MPAYLELLPAVDVQGGRAVQLVQGVAGSEKTFGDPVEAALRWQEAGAEWIHLVDLDAAFGRGHNRELQAKIVGTLDIRVEMSGGIRDDDTIPPNNEPEIFLTEAYSLHFEGKPESVSPDRRVVRIVRPGAQRAGARGRRRHARPRAEAARRLRAQRRGAA